MKWISSHPWHLVAGWVIWVAWFVIAYGGLSVACQLNPPLPEQGVINWINLSLLILTLGVVIFLGKCAFVSWVLVKTLSFQERFNVQIATAVYIAATFGTLVVGVSILVAEPCV